MGSLFLFILSRTPTSAALNGAVTFMHAALESWLRPRSISLRFFVSGKVEIFQLCYSTPLLMMGIFRLCLALATELYDCRWRIAARWPRAPSSPDGLILTS